MHVHMERRREKGDDEAFTCDTAFGKLVLSSGSKPKLAIISRDATRMSGNASEKPHTTWT